jgi:nicotinamidase-related amidase
MPEQTFRSPNFFEREIDLSAPQTRGPVGTPAGVISTANKGPAFVPVTIANFDEFKATFGDLDPKRFGPYAVNEFLKHKAALTFIRVLGAGANSTDAEIATTVQTGRVKNAGFRLDGTVASHDNRGRHNGAVQFITARHMLQTAEASGNPMFTDNNSFSGGFANLVRGMVFMASGSRMMVLDGNESAVGAFTATGPDDLATLVNGKFKLVISSTLGNGFVNTDGNPGVRVFTASLNPTDADYFAKVLNTDPDRFVQEQHVLYGDFAVDDEIATPTVVAILSGSTATSNTSGDSTLIMRQAFGAFDTRYQTPKTTMFISQPFGATEYDLFSLEALDDGEFANKLYKISITNIKASLDDSKPHGTFTVHIRDWNDTDQNPLVLESFPNCSLNPLAGNYVAKLIGDRKVYYNFDSSLTTERRVIATGKYANNSKLVRVTMSDAVERALVPAKSLPFGFRGIEVLKTNNSFTDTGSTTPRLVGVLGISSGSAVSGSILPPVPFRFKVTKGEIPAAPAFDGAPGPTELANTQLHWGVKFERNTTPLNANLSSEKNKLLESYTKFMGIKKLDVLVTGSGADTFNNNKFTLAKVAFSNTSITHLTGTINDHMREAAYIRNATLDLSDYTVNTSIGKRITLATMLAQDTAANFNKFSSFTKFTNMMFGGYDGVNFLDNNARRLNDRSTSFDAGGGAELSYVAPGMLVNPNGTGQSNSTVLSYLTAVDIMTDPMVVNINILNIPGIRESFITDYTMKNVRDYGLAFYVMDIASYDDEATRLYDDSVTRPDVDKSASALDARAVDNNFTGCYFPNVFIDDLSNKRRLKVPSSVAAMGALAYNDRVSYPWFAPAGFNRAALDFVTNVEVRLNVTDRDRLYDSRINPIATFPKLGYVIYGQKTLQIAKSSLDRVNVRRLLLEVKRIIIGIANLMVFENNTLAVRNKFVSDSVQQLGLIQAQSGIERFEVVCNETNNTQEDIDLNKLNGRIVIVPTKTIEFIALDFIITASGVEFV